MVVSKSLCLVVNLFVSLFVSESMFVSLLACFYTLFLNESVCLFVKLFVCL